MQKKIPASHSNEDSCITMKEIKEINDITVALHTFNEEESLENTLKCLSIFPSLFIVDTFSNDNTFDLCKKYTDNILQIVYHNTAQIRNEMLKLIKTKWVLFVDSDEIITPDLFNEIMVAINTNTNIHGYYIKRKNFFLSGFIHHSGWYPDYTMRLFQVKCGTFEKRDVHAKCIIIGKEGYLKNPILHYAHNSVSQYISKINRLTTLEVTERMKVFHDYEWNKYTFTKNIFYLMPGKPFIRFIYRYFLRLGFLDGKKGLTLAILSFLYDYVAYLKVKEFKNRPNSH